MTGIAYNIWNSIRQVWQRRNVVRNRRQNIESNMAASIDILVDSVLKDFNCETTKPEQFIRYPDFSWLIFELFCLFVKLPDTKNVLN